MKSSPPDVIYVHGLPGVLESIELRFSLRSLRNLPHGRVWVTGTRPSWIRNVGFIPVHRVGNESKQENSLRNLYAALTHEGVADEVYLMNDDFYILQEIEEPAVAHRGIIGEQIRNYRWPPNRSVRQTGYRHGMGQTCIALRQGWGIEEPLNYELHIPMRFDRMRAVAAIDNARALGPVPVLQPRTLYGNLYSIGGEYWSQDVKISGIQSLPPDAVYASTTDESFRHKDVGRRIRSMFPEPSSYEAR